MKKSTKKALIEPPSHLTIKTGKVLPKVGDKVKLFKAIVALSTHKGVLFATTEEIGTIIDINPEHLHFEEPIYKVQFKQLSNWLTIDQFKLSNSHLLKERLGLNE